MAVIVIGQDSASNPTPNCPSKAWLMKFPAEPESMNVAETISWWPSWMLRRWYYQRTRWEPSLFTWSVCFTDDEDRQPNAVWGRRNRRTDIHDTTCLSPLESERYSLTAWVPLRVPNGPQEEVQDRYIVWVRGVADDRVHWGSPKLV